jgi:hypothetical protein
MSGGIAFEGLSAQERAGVFTRTVETAFLLASDAATCRSSAYTVNYIVTSLTRVAAAGERARQLSPGSHLRHRAER